MRWTGRVQSVEQIASFLQGQLGRPVVNKTGLTGKYDFTLEYSRAAMSSAGAPLDAANDSGLSIEGAVQEQLGLRLESKKAPVDVMVLDHVERVPPEN
jgi:uncharacterized protein (TIGR03435 family)